MPKRHFVILATDYNEMWQQYGLDPVDDWAVFTALARYVNASGTCYPHEETLASDLGRSVRYVRYHIQRLRVLPGFVVERQMRKQGGWGRNVYTLPTWLVRYGGALTDVPGTDQDDDRHARAAREP